MALQRFRSYNTKGKKIITAPPQKAGGCRTDTAGGTCLSQWDRLSSHNSSLLSPIWVSAKNGYDNAGTCLLSLMDIPARCSWRKGIRLFPTIHLKYQSFHQASLLIVSIEQLNIHEKNLSPFPHLRTFVFPHLFFPATPAKKCWQTFAHQWDVDLSFCFIQLIRFDSWGLENDILL